VFKRNLGSPLFVAFFFALSSVARADEIDATLQQIRKKNKLPALAVLVLHQGQVQTLKTLGVRKAGTKIGVTKTDKFHMGSCTKAMTATLIGCLVEKGQLQWTTTIGDIFKDLPMKESYRRATLLHLLSHRAGFPNASWPPGKTFSQLHSLPGAPHAQRKSYLRWMLQSTPAGEPGEKFVYSNSGYAIAGIMAETVTKIPYETLIQKTLFDPLKMKTVGFGSMGKAGKIEEPWQHRWNREKDAAIPVGPGPMSDNPAVIAPAGTSHMSMPDWSKFIQMHLDGMNGRSTLLKPQTVRLLHNPIFAGDYSLGWAEIKRPWGGKVSTHNGSNTMNFCVVWLAPEKNFAVLVATNIGGPNAAKACNEAAGAMIRRFLTQKIDRKPKGKKKLY
jgi:CubicO group peptidase (beta-lactamase class C family)